MGKSISCKDTEKDCSQSVSTKSVEELMSFHERRWQRQRKGGMDKGVENQNMATYEQELGCKLAKQH